MRKEYAVKSMGLRLHRPQVHLAVVLRLAVFKIIKSFVFKIVASPYLIHSEKKKFHKDSDFKEGKRRNMRTYYTLSIKNILYSF